MALIQCDECKNSVSDKAEKCPHCGAPVVIPKPEIRKFSSAPITPKFTACRKCGHGNIANTITCPKCHTFCPNKSNKELEDGRKFAKGIGWFAAPALLIVSAKAFAVAPFATIFCILVSIISFPLTRRKLKEKIKFIPNVWLTILLYLIACIFAGQSQNKIDAHEQEIKAEETKKEEQLKAEATEKENKKKFEKYQQNSAQVWLEFKRSIESKKYEAAKKIATDLSGLKKFDPILAKKIDSADQLIAFSEAKDETPSLLKKLNEYPEDSEALKIYKRLLIGNPQNKKYEKKIKEIEERLIRAKKESEALSRAEEQVKSQFSAWDGSHIALEKYIKSNMNDPDSYKHVSTKYWLFKDHMIVLTQFRGKNAFGATITNSWKAKVSLDGSDITVLEQY